jgi:hypothetical protein
VRRFATRQAEQITRAVVVDGTPMKAVDVLLDGSTSHCDWLALIASCNVRPSNFCKAVLRPQVATARNAILLDKQWLR